MDPWRAIEEAHGLADDPEEKAEWARMLRPQETFARAYAQWIAWKTGDRRILAQLDDRITATGRRMRLRQWPLDEWLSIAPAMDRLFAAAGWLTG